MEYAGPFFPFLGEAGGNAASLNAYRQYLSFMKPSMALRHVQAFGNDLDIVVTRAGQKLQVESFQQSRLFQDTSISPGETVEVVLPKTASAQTADTQPSAQQN